MSRAKKIHFYPEHLRACIDDSEYSYSEFASDINITPTHLSRILKNGQITESLLDTVSEVLDIRPDFFTTKKYVDYYLDDIHLSRATWEMEKVFADMDHIMRDFLYLIHPNGLFDYRYNKMSKEAKNALLKKLRIILDYLLPESRSIPHKKTLEHILEILQNIETPGT